MCISLSYSFVKVYAQESGIAGSNGSSVFRRTLIRFFIVATEIYTHTNSVGGFPFLHALFNVLLVDFLMTVAISFDMVLLS